MNEKQPFFAHYINEKNSNFGSFLSLNNRHRFFNQRYPHPLIKS